MSEASIPLIIDYKPNSPLVYPSEAQASVATLQITATPPQVAISQARFLSAAIALAEKLPEKCYAINLCQNRGLFLLSFVAVLLRNMTNLLPPDRQLSTVFNTAANYPDSFVITDHGLNYQPLATFRVDTLKPYSQISDKTALSPPLIKAEHIAAIAFTSGSTGKPTANKKLWRTLVGTAERLSRRFIDKNSPPVIIATVPSQHMYGLEMTVMMALQGNCSLAVGQPFYPQDIAIALAALPCPRLLVTTPVHLRVLHGATANLPQVDRIISATAPLAKTLAADSEHLFQTVVEEIYGCTEAGSSATRRTNITDEWLLLDGMQLHPQNSDIEISGHHLSQSVKLQDKLEILPNNRFRFLGRANDILNVAGKRASLANINQKLLNIEAVEDAVVFVPETEHNKASRPAALVVSTLSEREILTALSSEIDPVFLPRPLRKIGVLPRNETGKLQYSVLEQLLSQGDL